MTARKLGLNLLILAAVMATAAACGRKSGLDTPYEAAVQAREDAQERAGTGRPAEPAPPKPEKNRPFILDPLIE